jgi:hypothetical protein
LLNSPCYNLTITVNSSDRWTPFFSVPRWYDAVASHCHLFSRDHDHVAETSRADHYRAPRRNCRIAPLAPTLDGWDDRCVPLSSKEGNAPAVLPLPSLACFRICQYRRSCFPLRLALANPPPAHPHCCFAHSPSKLCCHLHRRPIEEVGRRTREEPQPASPTMPQFVETLESLRWTLVSMYLCIVGGVCLLVVFHVHIHRPLPHELR